jgi:hypothetical protein
MIDNKSTRSLPPSNFPLCLHPKKLGREPCYHGDTNGASGRWLGCGCCLAISILLVCVIPSLFSLFTQLVPTSALCLSLLHNFIPQFCSLPPLTPRMHWLYKSAFCDQLLERSVHCCVDLGSSTSRT